MEARFCNACGARLAEDAGAASTPDLREPRSYTPRHLADRILRSRAALQGERKLVTVLFCDLADSTPIAEKLGPEAMHALMDRCFQSILDQVHRYEGTVNQFLGDGVMALFGAPIALEHAPRRAVTAALAIQRALEPIRAEVKSRHGVEFQMRIGIHSGPVVVGSVGDDLRMDYTAVGDTTNLADRLQGLARPGSVLISETTARGVAGYADLVDLGTIDVKGKSEPVRAFEVQGERAARDRIEAAEGRLTPLAGRERELHALEDAFASAQAGAGRVVFVVGEAGIGKSRLLHEFRRRLADTPHAWIEGRCASYARSSAFHPVADGLRRSFGIDDRDDDAGALAKIETRETGRGGDLEWTLPYVRSLLALPTLDAAVDEMDPATRRSEIFRALRARVLRVAEREPCVLVIEDLHWIDRASEELLDYLAESAPALRLLVVLTHRPGYSHPFGDRSYHSRLVIDPLAEDGMAAMARAILGGAGLPEALRTLIARKAEGNPFFVEELTKSLVEDGALQLREGQAELARPLSEVLVPDSVQDLLMARLDRLPDGPKQALQIASVIGREFAMRLLERIHEADDRIEPVVDELRALELIYEKSVHPELAYMFKHALTHDVAYASVLESRRRGLHRIVGAAIEELYPDRLAEHYEALAHHYTEAEEWEKAFLYRERASARAAANYANPDAAEHCRQALAVAERLGDDVPSEVRCGLEERLGAVCGAMSEYRESAEAFLRAAAVAPTPAERGMDVVRSAYSLFWAHEFDDVERLAQQTLDEARSHGEREPEAYALLMQGFLAAIQGFDEDSRDLIRAADALGPQHPEVRVLAGYLEGQRSEWNGQYREAVAHQARAIEVARKHRLSGLLVGGQWFRGKALCCLGRWDEALGDLHGALELADRIGDRGWKARVLNTVGWALEEIGQGERAGHFNRQSVEEAEGLLEMELVVAVPELLGNARVNLAGNRLADGDPDAAAELLAPVHEDLEHSSDPWMRWRYANHVERTEARIDLARGDPDAAITKLDACITSARRHTARKLEASALLMRSQALLHLERLDLAEEGLATTLEQARAIEHAPLQWRAHALLAECARRSGDPARARSEHETVRTRIRESSNASSDDDTRRGLRRLADRLIADPLAACR